MRQLKLESLVLRRGGADPERQAENGQAANLHPAHGGHRILPLFFWSTTQESRGTCFRDDRARCKSSCIPNFRIYRKSPALYSGAARGVSGRALTSGQFCFQGAKRTLQFKNGTSVCGPERTCPLMSASARLDSA